MMSWFVCAIRSYGLKYRKQQFILTVVVFTCQVIRLLSRLMTQGAGSWNASQHSSCQCYTEVRLSPSFPMLSLNFVLFTLTFDISFLLVGSNGGDRLPSSVVGSSRSSRAHRINRSVMFLIWSAGSLIPTLHFEVIHHFPSVRPCLLLAAVVVWRSSVSAQRVYDAAVLAAAAS